jgi:hypothetical protein
MRYVIALKGSSAARFKPGETRQGAIATKLGHCQMTLQTLYSNEGFEDPIPRDLWVELRGQFSCTLDDAINECWNAANSLTPLLALSANSPVGDLDVLLGFDATPTIDQHQFFENFLPDGVGPPGHGRSLDAEATAKLIDCIQSHSERDRLQRAIEQYRRSLNYWRDGQQTFAIMHLWIAVEAVTKIALRLAQQVERCASEEDLAVKWSVRAGKVLTEKFAAATSFMATPTATPNYGRRVTALSTATLLSILSAPWQRKFETLLLRMFAEPS